MRLGVAIQEVNQALADSFRLDKPEGALVSDIDRASPAEASGMKVGDVIRRVDQARGMVAHAGRSVALLILRGKDRIFIPVRLG